MTEFTKEDLIKRLLVARIDNYNTVNQLANGIGMWMQFQYLFRFALERCFQETDIDDIRLAVKMGDITNPDIIDLIAEGDELREQTNRLILKPTALEEESARQGAMKLLRRLEGEIEKRSVFDKLCGYLGLHKNSPPPEKLVNSNKLTKTSVRDRDKYGFSRTRAD